MGAGLLLSNEKSCSDDTAFRGAHPARLAAITSGRTSFGSTRTNPAPTKSAVTRSSVSLAGAAAGPLSQVSKQFARGVSVANSRTTHAKSWKMRRDTESEYPVWHYPSNGHPDDKQPHPFVKVLRPCGKQAHSGRFAKLFEHHRSSHVVRPHATKAASGASNP